MTSGRPGLADALEALVHVEAWRSRVAWPLRLRESRPIALECDGVSLRVAGVERTAPWRHGSVAEAAEALVARGLAPGDLLDPAPGRGWFCEFCGGTGLQMSLAACDRCRPQGGPCRACGAPCSCSVGAPRGFTATSHSRALLAAVASLGPRTWLRAESVARDLAARRDAVPVWAAWAPEVMRSRAEHGWETRYRRGAAQRVVAMPSQEMAAEGLGVLLFPLGPGGSLLVAEALG